MSYIKNLLLTFLLLLLGTTMFGQGWEKIYPDSGADPLTQNPLQGGYHTPTPDGGFLLFGHEENDALETQDIVIIKTDAEAEEQSRVTVVSPDRKENSGPVTALNDGNCVMAGVFDAPTFYNTDVLVQKFDLLGNSLWEFTYGDSLYDQVTRIIQTQDDNLLFAVRTDEYGTSSKESNLIKLGLDGNLLWEVNYPDFIIYDLIELDDGNILLTGKIGNFAVNRLIDSDGGMLQQEEYALEYARGSRIISTIDGGYLIAIQTLTSAYQDFRLWKIDANLALEWEQIYETDGAGVETAAWFFATQILQKDNGDFIVTGFRQNSPPYNGFLMKTDNTGNELWIREIQEGWDYFSYFNGGVVDLQEDGYMLFGHAEENAMNGASGLDDYEGLYVVKTDNNGFVYTDLIEGHVYYDADENCLDDSGEISLPSFKAKIQADGETYYRMTNLEGEFTMLLDTGSFSVELIPPNELWEPCDPIYEGSFDIFYDTLDLDLGAIAVVDCPNLTVDILNAFLRRCFETSYYIKYCNDGTIPADDVTIDVTLDPLISIVDANFPYTTNGNVYTFEIGTVNVGACDQLNLQVFTSCDAEIGATLCNEAHIYPDTFCLANDPSWSGASVELYGGCEQDSVMFTLENVGDGNMAGPLNYIVIIDDVILQTEPFDLEVDETKSINLFSGGATVRMEAMQEPGHPGNSMPSLAFEGCGGPINSGFVSQFSMDDYDDFVDIQCNEVNGAVDPNDKRGFPLGYGEEHFINEGQELEYIVRFQNTGNDTAFTVVIRDTISEHLDLQSLSPGASSHDYEFEIYGDRIAKFTYNNIMLPDSFVNEVASHGVVKYTIRQNPENEIGDVIRNSAAIYFDFNEPVITNETWHTIGEDFITVPVLEQEDISNPDIEVYPNPFSGSTNFDIQGNFNGPFMLEVRDATGRLIDVQTETEKAFLYNSKKLNSGLYFYTVLEAQRVISSGKFTKFE